MQFYCRKKISGSFGGIDRAADDFRELEVIDRGSLSLAGDIRALRGRWKRVIIKS